MCRKAECRHTIPLVSARRYVGSRSCISFSTCRLIYLSLLFLVDMRYMQLLLTLILVLRVLDYVTLATIVEVPSFMSLMPMSY